MKAMSRGLWDSEEVPRAPQQLLYKSGNLRMICLGLNLMARLNHAPFMSNTYSNSNGKYEIWSHLLG